MTFTLEATPRTASAKKVAALRADGNLPGVVYGPKQAPLAVTLAKGAFDKVLKEAGESSVVTITGLEKPIDVLIHDVAFDPRKGGIIHVDFYAIEKGKKLTVDVPLNFIGEAPALKLGGTLTKVIHEVEVEAAAADLPKTINVDISALVDLGSQIHIGDLQVPSGVIIKGSPDEVVVLVQEVKEEADAPVLDMSAIEVEKKGKTEDSAVDGK